MDKKYDAPKQPPKPKDADDERPLAGAEAEDVETLEGGGGDERRGPNNLGGG